jgi:hypothetical protein
LIFHGDLFSLGNSQLVNSETTTYLPAGRPGACACRR